ncbi:hypothetical protein HV135_02110 [Citrobacter sp. RHBSTW-00229]|uniref:hypothetical protein n=1 Tax=Citrobacter sp. RHBSTW-00229 TaxID=2742641 RepID=UPI0015EA08AE|nr:hypothetical protein [Citrobacter sp. RHBSTW-00229]QLX38108.1 hypothetical protein HV135_02110 [Citrobacter sp. RHBSTW-00229]
MGEISVKTGNNARNGGKNSLNRLIRCVCGKKIGPDPRNFNQRVSLGRNDLLIRTFPSRNYHHFFPRKYVEKNCPAMEPNLIANITLIDAASNNKIKAKAPSLYVNELKAGNSKLQSSLRSHLINNPKDFGILEDDYEKFIGKRSEVIAEALNEALNPEI